MESRGTLRALAALAIAVIFGVTSLVFLVQLISSYQTRIEEARKPEDTVMVMIAARDLYPGVNITEEDIQALQIPPRFLPSGVFLSPDFVVGQRPRERILVNEFIRASRLANPETGEGLNAIIPRSMRAISVRIQDGAALSGHVDPGNFVDIILTVTPDLDENGRPIDGKQPETHTILQSMFVLAVNNRTQRGAQTVDRGNTESTVTLMVDAKQAETVAYAERVGQIRLSLRNDLDSKQVASMGVDMSQVLGIIKAPKVEPRKRTARTAPKVAPKVEEPAAPTVRVIRGSEVEDKQLEAGQ